MTQRGHSLGTGLGERRHRVVVQRSCMGDNAHSARRGEQATERYLIRRGWTILARNWLGPGGELDIVATRRGVIMLCEVKARGAAEEDVLRPAQVRRLAATFDLYRQTHHSRGDQEVRMALFTVDLGRRPLRVRRAYDIEPEDTGLGVHWNERRWSEQGP